MGYRLFYFEMIPLFFLCFYTKQYNPKYVIMAMQTG